MSNLKSQNKDLKKITTIFTHSNKNLLLFGSSGVIISISSLSPTSITDKSSGCVSFLANKLKCEPFSSCSRDPKS